MRIQQMFSHTKALHFKLRNFLIDKSVPARYDGFSYMTIFQRGHSNDEEIYIYNILFLLLLSSGLLL